ncbi:hypothetical protein ABZU45_30195 [Streptomyces avermitilis]|uniref:hypothetical protein n=1 Tax=Streptomyces avermitilis TaxID=33903 RepID=UPI0033BD12C9
MHYVPGVADLGYLDNREIEIPPDRTSPNTSVSFWPLGGVWHTDLVDSVPAGAPAPSFP